MKKRNRIIGVLRILIPLAGLLNHQNVLMSGTVYYLLAGGLVLLFWGSYFLPGDFFGAKKQPVYS